MKMHTLFIFFSISLLISLSACKSNSKDKAPKKEVENTTPQKNAQIQLLDSLIKTNPNNSQAYYKRARYYYDKQNLPKALIDILYALDLNKKQPANYLLAGDIYLEMNQGQDAIDLMSEGINNNPGNQALYERAVEYNFYMKNYQSAMNFANDLLKINKNNPTAYFFKGLIHKETKNIPKAISSFQTCVEQDPLHYNAYMQLATLFSRKKNNLALKYYNSALKISPDSREAIYGKGYFYQEQKKYNLAKEEYKKLVIANRKDYEALFNLGHCFLAQDSLQKAERHFEMAFKANRSYVDAVFMLGQIAERKGDIPNAKIHYQNALKMLPGNETILESLNELKEK